MKLLGSILLIIGTTIGAGILALPLATAPGGFWYSCVLLLVCWVVSTFSAFVLLEVNLWLPEGSNLVSMAKATLGLPGQILVWFFYLLLLYSLTSAYVAGGTDVLHGLLADMNLSIALWLSSLIFVLVFGYVVYLGIQKVDYVNRVFMSIKLIAFVLLIGFVVPHVHLHFLPADHLKLVLSATTVAITSFGYSIIIPSLRAYFNSDIKKLRIALLCGSLIPLIFYIIWEVAVFGVVRAGGAGGLMAIGRGSETTTHLVNAIAMDVHTTTVEALVRLFSSICMVTSFLGVSLSLRDFLFDGLNMRDSKMGSLFVHGFTFLPSLIIVVFMPSIFIMAIRYAGVSCIILLILMPLMMVWRGRYVLGKTGYQVLPRGGKPILIFFIFVAVLLLLLSWV